MEMIFLNGIAIFLGGFLGHKFRGYVSEKVSSSIIKVVALNIIVIALKEALNYRNGMLNLAYLVIGVIVGEVIDLDAKLKNMGEYIQNKFTKGKEGIAKGFVVSTIIFCVGSMAILGPLEIALKNNNEILTIKSIMDGISAIIFAASYGVGVIFSGMIVIVYQFIIYLFGSAISTLVTQEIIQDISSVGGVVLLALGITIVFGERNIKVSNMLPAIFLPIVYSLFLRLL
ncbi:MAG: DUF554 domain-containing protein [Fusobacterium sp. JB021]|nr:DUF554 domain-containing protein [Fusobacterium sp. JB020]MDP0493772.1 DUF554 domain-containing protein [Fusobacterium sp. JB021]MDP0507256.1 DUF554 domain-containing protein [Fusobacterium sp. JB019]